jgi:hypothetical protein
MPKILKDLVIDEVSSVTSGAGSGVRVTLFKRDGGPPPKGKETTMQDELVEKIARAHRVQGRIRELAKRGREENATRFDSYGAALDRYVADHV